MITNLNPISDEKYYIGVRSSTVDPANDDYWSSSVYLLEAINSTGQQHFKKEVLQVWPNRKAAEKHEAQLHAKYDVKTNDEFYNKANATGTGFSTYGNTQAVEKMLESRLNNGKWSEAMLENNTNPENCAKRAAGIRKRIAEDPTYVERRIASRLDTVRSKEWQQTVGEQVRENMRKTFNDPTWKNTVGVEKSRKISELKRERDRLNKKTCPHCGKVTDPAVYGRWHGDRCKENK